MGRRGFLGMPIGTCGICGKDVHFKPIFGTIHICLSAEDLAVREWANAQMAAQIAETRRRTMYRNPVLAPEDHSWKIGQRLPNGAAVVSIKGRELTWSFDSPWYWFGR